MTIKSWEDYKEFAFSNPGKFKDKQQEVLSLNLSASIGNMFNSFMLEITEEKENKPRMIDAIGDVLWACALIESHYGLTSSRASQALNYSIQKSAEINIVLDFNLLQADFAEALVGLMDSALEEDLDSMEYAMSKIMTGILNISIYKDFSLRDSVLSSCNKIAQEIKSKIPSTTRNHKKEFDEAKKEIKASKVKEVTIDIIKKQISEGEYVYQGLKVRNGRKISKFETGELILDFFNASNSIAKELPKQHYNLLYTIAFRAVLDNLISNRKLVSAYLYEDKLINASTLKKSSNKTDVFADKTKYRPVLIKPEMTELDHLLNYISDVKKLQIKKI
jgi:hypothetical protein